jgi:high-affinity Fe2+/Pb2+ permease
MRGRLMRLVARRSAAVAVSAAGFVLAWWVCQELIRLDEGISLAIASAVLAVVLAVAGWWAARDADSGRSDGSGRRLVQKARAGRDVNMAGRDQTITNYPRRDE